MKNKLKTLNDFEIPKKLSKKELEKNFSKNFKKAYKLLSQDYPILNESFEVKYSLTYEYFKHSKGFFGIDKTKVKRVNSIKEEVSINLYHNSLFLDYFELFRKEKKTFYFYYGYERSYLGGGNEKENITSFLLPYSLEDLDNRLKASAKGVPIGRDQRSYFLELSFDSNSLELSNIINCCFTAFYAISRTPSEVFYEDSSFNDIFCPQGFSTDGVIELKKIRPYTKKCQSTRTPSGFHVYDTYTLLKVDEEIPDNLNELIAVLNDKAVYENFCNTYNTIIEKEAKRMLKREIKTKKEIKIAKEDFFNKFDKNDNGIIDVIEEDGFSKLLKKHQDTITKIDQKFVFDFVKLSKSMKEKQDNLTHTFSLLKSADSKLELNEIRDTFEVQHMGYAIMIFEAYRMLLSLIQNDMVTFYELYAEFESNRIFESQWQKDLHQMKKDLTSIKEINKMSLQTLLTIASQLKEMELSMIQGFNMVNRTLERGFESVNQNIQIMNKSLTNELKGINNKLWWNNLFQVVQIYQNRKTNKLLSR